MILTMVLRYLILYFDGLILIELANQLSYFLYSEKFETLHCFLGSGFVKGDG